MRFDFTTPKGLKITLGDQKIYIKRKNRLEFFDAVYINPGHKSRHPVEYFKFAFLKV